MNTAQLDRLIIKGLPLGLGAGFGAIAGLAVGGPYGLGVGLLLGLAAGLVVVLAPKTTLPPLETTNPTIVSESVQCYPSGQVARCDFVRDGQNGAFLDVKSCDLHEQCDDVRCEKACLKLMNQG